DGIRDGHVTGVQTCALPISHRGRHPDVLPRQPSDPVEPTRVLEVPRPPDRGLEGEPIAVTPASPGIADREAHEAGHRAAPATARSVERRVGKEGGCRGWSGR